MKSLNLNWYLCAQKSLFSHKKKIKQRIRSIKRIPKINLDAKNTCIFIISFLAWSSYFKSLVELIFNFDSYLALCVFLSNLVWLCFCVIPSILSVHIFLQLYNILEISRTPFSCPKSYREKDTMNFFKILYSLTSCFMAQTELIWKCKICKWICRILSSRFIDLIWLLWVLFRLIQAGKKSLNLMVQNYGGLIRGYMHWKYI